MVKNSHADLAAVKALLGEFAAARAGRPAAQLQLEYGDLLLYLVRLADQAGIDLIEAGILQSSRDADVPPRLVRDRSR